MVEHFVWNVYYWFKTSILNVSYWLNTSIWNVSYLLNTPYELSLIGLTLPYEISLISLTLPYEMSLISLTLSFEMSLFGRILKFEMLPLVEHFNIKYLLFWAGCSDYVLKFKKWFTLCSTVLTTAKRWCQRNKKRSKLNN